MPRIIVTAEQPTSAAASVLLAETVHPVHLSSDHGARQLIERLRWALGDAEQLERAGSQARGSGAGAAAERARAAA